MSRMTAEELEEMQETQRQRAHRLAAVTKHNLEIIDNVPEAARRGFKKASLYHEFYIVSIEQRGTRWIVETAYSLNHWSARTWWIVGPRGGCVRVIP